VYGLTVVPYDFESYYMDVRPSITVTGRKRTLCVRIAFVSSNARKVECSRACQRCVGRMVKKCKERWVVLPLLPFTRKLTSTLPCIILIYIPKK
jgi:hypothetical protein